MSPARAIPFFKRTTPVDSKTSPINRIKSSLAMLQILVANELDAQLLNLRPHMRVDQGIELVLKFAGRGMGVKLGIAGRQRSEEHTSELQSQSNLVCRLLLEK